MVTDAMGVPPVGLCGLLGLQALCLCTAPLWARRANPAIGRDYGRNFNCRLEEAFSPGAKQIRDMMIDLRALVARWGL